MKQNSPCEVMEDDDDEEEDDNDNDNDEDNSGDDSKDSKVEEGFTKFGGSLNRVQTEVEGCKKTLL
ncbi:hypothetical protein WN944_023292 [Citrus x changshan-huyou]|uniref:Uncharacterized protein n=1 Tax=Citrus x changshan-huyou TaxID=2935761 RepID=A0AAP0R153_9ROSI